MVQSQQMSIKQKIKKKINFLFNKLNYFHKNHFKKKEYNNFIEGILISQILGKEKIKIIQVGANDGIKGDPLYNFVVKFNNKIKLLAIEPQEGPFNQLKKNYSNSRNIFFSQKAIGDGSEKEFYSFNKNYSKFHNTDNTFDRHSSFEKTHLIERLTNSNIKNNEINNYINISKIKSYKLHEIIDDINDDFNEIDFLQIDAEGYDDEVIKNSSIEKYKFKFINYEFKNLSEKRLNNLHEYLQQNGYEIIRWKKSDELAYLV
mgnify:CR=1 FL=1